MPWWNEEITEDIAIQFLEECREYTKRIINEHQPELKTRRFSHVFPKSEVPFVPLGAVIHATRTQSLWDALRVIGSEAYGTHFIVASTRWYKHPDLKLVSSVPCSISMPMGWESAVSHSAYFSTISWGIDLRNIGRVRPWRSPIGANPTPIFTGEERDSMFKFDQPGEPSFYWWDNLWRTPFKGRVDKWFDYYYEIPSFGQIQSLIILLRVLNALHPLDRRAVIPASCVYDIEPTIPHIPWDIIRRFVFDDVESIPTQEDFGNIFTLSGGSSGDFAPTRTDESFVIDNAKLHRWRTASDDGILHFVINGKPINWSVPRNHTKAQFITNIKLLGYSPEDIDFAARLCVAANKMDSDRLQDIVAVVHKKVTKRIG